MHEEINQEEYLIANTTKEQRQYYVNNVHALVSLGGRPQEKEVIKICKRYVDGEIELSEVSEEIFNHANQLVSKYRVSEDIA